MGRPRLPRPGQAGISLFDIQARIGHASPEIYAVFPRQLSVRRTLESAWSDTFLEKPQLDGASHDLIDRCLRWFQHDLNPTMTGSWPPRNTTDESSLPEMKSEPDISPGRFSANEVGWADVLQFGHIPLSAQRVALFLRAIIKKPDLVILDEAFSGMDARLRDKCMQFLASGETGTLGHAKELPAAGSRVHTSNGSAVCMTGLEDRQCIIITSHVREEVPPFIRQWLCLPDPDSGRPPRQGVFRRPLHHDWRQWDEVWALKDC
ncbi:MAG: hypothetical protein M1826_002212 [Phylliscum demangeonii]|nr:MAG: hypothetical protein M1826_002212 [Phylliscum demangeonii]